MIRDSVGGLSGLSNPRVTFDSSSVVISESLGVVWAVDSTLHR